MAQLASASGLGPEGPVFESQYPDILPKELTDFQWVPFYCILWAQCEIMAQRKMGSVVKVYIKVTVFFGKLFS